MAADKWSDQIRACGLFFISIVVLMVIPLVYHCFVFLTALPLWGVNTASCIILLVGFHTLFLLLVVSYWKVIFTDAGGVPYELDEAWVSAGCPHSRRCLLTSDYSMERRWLPRDACCLLLLLFGTHHRVWLRRAQSNGKRARAAAPALSSAAVLYKLATQSHYNVFATACLPCLASARPWLMSPQISELNLAHRFGLEAEVSERVSDNTDNTP